MGPNGTFLHKVPRILDAIRKVRRALSNCIIAARAFIRLCQKKAAESCLSGKRRSVVGIHYVHTCIRTTLARSASASL